MSFNTIQIVRCYPVINGYVRLPDNHEKDRLAAPVGMVLSAHSGASLVSLTAGVGGAKTAGGKFGVQQLVSDMIRSPTDSR